MRVLIVLAVLSAGCTDRVARLEPVHAFHERAPHANVVMGHMTDARAEGDVIGRSHDAFWGTSYEVEADAPVAPWLEQHVRAALAESGLASSGATASPSPEELAIRLVRFEVTGRTWIHGVGIFDVALYGRSGMRAAKRLVIETTGLATDDGDDEWGSQTARLARWSAVEIARWTGDALAKSERHAREHQREEAPDEGW